MNYIRRHEWKQVLDFLEADTTSPIYLYFPTFTMTYYERTSSKFFPESMVSRFETNGEAIYENDLQWDVKKFDQSTEHHRYFCHFVHNYNLFHVLETRQNCYRLQEKGPFSVQEMFLYLASDSMEGLWLGQPSSI